jgi:hypothetical protein
VVISSAILAVLSGPGIHAGSEYSRKQTGEFGILSSKFDIKATSKTPVLSNLYLGFFRRVIVTLYQILFLPLWIFFGALVIPVVSIVVLFVLYTLLSPLMIILLFALGPLQNRCIRNSGIIITVILYPIISAIMVLILLIFVILFLFVRHRFEYHHGIYDPFM